MSERILAVQLADIGDLVLTTPALAALREARPGATIDLLAAAHALPLLPRGLVDNTLPFQRAGISASRALLAPANWPLLLQIARRRYDALILFHHFTLRGGMLKFRLIAAASGARRILGLQNGAAGFLTDSVADAGFGARHQAQYWLDLVALLGADKTPRPAKVQRQPFPLPAADSHAPLVVMHAGSGGYSPARRWDVARFADLARRLREAHDAQIVIVGQRGDDGEALAAALDFPAQSLVGRTSLPRLADVMARADLFVGADSGVMHLAAAAGAPVLGIFGPSNAEAWQPWTPGGLSAVLCSGVACSPCSYVGREIGAREGCPARTCMKLVSSAQAAAAANDLLAGRQAGGNRRAHSRDRRKQASFAARRAGGRGNLRWLAGADRRLDSRRRRGASSLHGQPGIRHDCAGRLDLPPHFAAGGALRARWRGIVMGLSAHGLPLARARNRLGRPAFDSADGG